MMTDEGEPENISDDPHAAAGRSTRWFAYIAVGIALASMLIGLAIMGWFVYWLFSRR